MELIRAMLNAKSAVVKTDKLRYLPMYLVNAIVDFHHCRPSTFEQSFLYCKNAPALMDMVKGILPTLEEVLLLESIPHASEMGDPEWWILHVTKDLFMGYDTMPLAHDRLKIVYATVQEMRKMAASLRALSGQYDQASRAASSL